MKKQTRYFRNEVPINKDKALHFITKELGYSNHEASDKLRNEMSIVFEKMVKTLEQTYGDYARVQENFDRRLGESEIIETKGAIIEELADFTVKIHSMSDDELRLLNIPNMIRVDEFAYVCKLEQQLREVKSTDMNLLNDELREKIKSLKDYAFIVKHPNTVVQSAEMGNAFIGTMLAVLNGFNMGSVPVNQVVQAKERAGIQLSEFDKKCLKNFASERSSQTQKYEELQKIYQNFVSTINSVQSSFDSADQLEQQISAGNQRIKVCCDLINNVRDVIYSKSSNVMDIRENVADKELQTLIDCIVFCNTPTESGLNFESLKDRVEKLPRDFALASSVLLKAYGYEFENYRKALQLFNIMLGQNNNVVFDELNSEDMKVKDIKQSVNSLNLVKKKVDSVKEQKNVTLSEKKETLTTLTQYDQLKNSEVQVLEKEDNENKVNRELNEEPEDVDVLQEQTIIEVKGTKKRERKPAPLYGWFFNEIKQAYLQDKLTTDEMKAQFANSSHDEQVEIIRLEANKHHIRSVKSKLSRLVESFDTLSQDEKEKLDDIAESYPLIKDKLKSKKELNEKNTSIENLEDKNTENQIIYDEKIVRDVRYKLALGALSKNGTVAYNNALRVALDKQLKDNPQLTEDQIREIEFDTLNDFLISASSMMFVEDITPYILVPEQVVKTKQYKKAIEKLKNNTKNSEK